MSDLERAVEAGLRAVVQTEIVGPVESLMDAEPIKAVVRSAFQAALEAGEIVMPVALDAKEASIAALMGEVEHQRARAEAAEQALVLANQDADALVAYMLESTILYLRPDGWWLATCGQAETRPAPPSIQALARAAHDLRVARQASLDDEAYWRQQR